MRLAFSGRTAQTTVHIDNPTGQEVVGSSVVLVASFMACGTGAVEVLKYRSTNKINFKAPKNDRLSYSAQKLGC